ncbi:MAG TPA: sigma-54 dependent transcriptional regulator [Thermoanaerobaculia bacterium]|nr:sigma-54 dependent transcriptional regulator [Thermoanaerobaculia bacterium]
MSGANLPRAPRPEPFPWENLVGNSPVMRGVKALLAKVAALPVSTVLLIGESGTGKDLIAKTIHFNSPRSARPFQNVTCSAIPMSLLESELFGHERGAFTDAKQQKKGLFELADGGTVYLDEIGETSPALQVKLLRFLEEKTFKRVGGSHDIRVEVRVIAATNRHLKAAMGEGSFRPDLYYRLSTILVRVPPLRERREDIRLLAETFLRSFAAAFGKNVGGLSERSLSHLESYEWPGNVRELKNVIERAVLLCEGDLLRRHDFLDFDAEPPSSCAFTLPATGVDLERLERDLLVQALERTGGNQTRAGQLLQLTRDQIRYRIEKFGLAESRAVDLPEIAG